MAILIRYTKYSKDLDSKEEGKGHDDAFRGGGKKEE